MAEARSTSRLGIDAGRQAIITNERRPSQSPRAEWQRVCRICASNGPHPHFVVREMMFGTREPFDYFECSNCKTLQIVDVPADLARHYPTDYLGSGFIDDGRPANPPSRRLITFLKRQRFAHVLHGRNVIGRLLSKWRPSHFPYPLGW